MKWLIETITCVSVLLIASVLHPGPAAAHPMDPLTADEIHTLSFHHVTTAEDFPVLPRHHGSFELKPHNFFDRNPALDLRRAPFEVTP